MFRRTLDACVNTCEPNDQFGSPKFRPFMDCNPCMHRRDFKFSKTQAALSHLKSLMEIYHWQSEQGRWFLHEDPHHSWSQGTKALKNLESLSGVRVTKTKQFGTFMTKCLPIVDVLESSSTNSGTSPISFATSSRGLRRTLEDG